MTVNEKNVILQLFEEISKACVYALDKDCEYKTQMLNDIPKQIYKIAQVIYEL